MSQVYVSLFEFIPEEITSNGVYKTFITGFVKVIDTISVIMTTGDVKRLPTVSLVISILNGIWPPSQNHFFENGGRIEHILQGITHTAKEQSWEYGDATYDEISWEEEEKLPAMEYFDNDFHYVETYVMKYLSTH